MTLPRDDAPVDLEAHVRALAPHAAVKGLFFQDLLARARSAGRGVDLEAVAGVPRRRYLPFLDYPAADFFRLKVAAAEALHAGLPRAAALRQLGRHAFPAFLGSRPGRLMFDLVAPTLGAALGRANGAYGVITSAGTVHHRALGARACELEYRAFPGFIETYQVGIVEGVCAHYRERATIELELRSIQDGSMHVRW